MRFVGAIFEFQLFDWTALRMEFCWALEGKVIKGICWEMTTDHLSLSCARVLEVERRLRVWHANSSQCHVS